MTAARATRPRAAAVLAIGWGLGFAAIHVAWALGSTAGLDGRKVTGVLMVINVVAIPLCLLAAWVAWRLRDDRRAATAPAFVRHLAWAVCAVLALRGLGTIQALIAPPDDATTLTRLVDPFFLLGGVLFGLVARASAPAGAVELDDRLDVHPGAERVGDEAVLVRAGDEPAHPVDVGARGDDDARPEHDVRDPHRPLS